MFKQEQVISSNKSTEQKFYKLKNNTFLINKFYTYTQVPIKILTLLYFYLKYVKFTDFFFYSSSI